LKAPFLHPLPADITKYVHGGINTVTFRSALLGERGHLVVQLVQQLDAEQAAASVLQLPSNNVDNKATTVATTSATSTTTSTHHSLDGGGGGGGGGQDDDDDEIVEQGSIVSLFDPLSLARITTPVRGVDCQHSQSFDLATYLSYSQSAQVCHADDRFCATL
jgi:hypothetical protein